MMNDVLQVLMSPSCRPFRGGGGVSQRTCARIPSQEGSRPVRRYVQISDPSRRKWLILSSEYEPYYDVYLENHPEFSDRAQLELEKKEQAKST